MKYYKSYRRINKDAEIFGFPFMMFFALLLLSVFSLLIILLMGFIFSVIWFLIYIGIIIVSWLVYQKYGLKQTLKNIELYFRNPEVIKIKGSIKIKKGDFNL